MKKILLTTIALSALLAGCANKPGKHELSAACIDKCNAQGKRVDVQFSAEEGDCKCSTGARTV